MRNETLCMAVASIAGAEYADDVGNSLPIPGGIAARHADGSVWALLNDGTLMWRTSVPRAWVVWTLESRHAWRQWAEV